MDADGILHAIFVNREDFHDFLLAVLTPGPKKNKGDHDIFELLASLASVYMFTPLNPVALRILAILKAIRFSLTRQVFKGYGSVNEDSLFMFFVCLNPIWPLNGQNSIDSWLF